MFLIQNNRKTLQTVRFVNKKGDVERLTFNVGHLEVTKDQAEGLMNHPLFRAGLGHDKNFSWVGSAPQFDVVKENGLEKYVLRSEQALKKAEDVEKKGEPETALESLNLKDAVEVIEKTWDAEQLKFWKDKDSRKGVHKAIDKQLDSLKVRSYDIREEDQAIEWAKATSDKDLLQDSLEKEDREAVKEVLLDRIGLGA